MRKHCSPKWNLSPKEEEALRVLKRLEHLWPGTLALQAGTGGLTVLKLGEDNQPVCLDSNEFALDQEYIVAHVDIRADGGDPW